MVHFGEFLKTWSLQSNSVTRQDKNWWKMPKFKCDIVSNLQTMWLGWLNFLANTCRFNHWVKTGKILEGSKVWVAKKKSGVVIWRLNNCWEKLGFCEEIVAWDVSHVLCSSSKVDVGKLDLQRILSWDDHVSALLRCSDDPLRSFEDWSKREFVSVQHGRVREAWMLKCHAWKTCWSVGLIFTFTSSSLATNKHYSIGY